MDLLFKKKDSLFLKVIDLIFFLFKICFKFAELNLKPMVKSFKFKNPFPYYDPNEIAVAFNLVVNENSGFLKILLNLQLQKCI